MTNIASTRLLARRLLPPAWRRRLRRTLEEVPHRIRDLPVDVASHLLPRSYGGPLPPARLRSKVGRSSSRDEFRLVATEGARRILTAFESARDPQSGYPAWLDFGCGCGRVARYVAEAPVVEEFHGVDVDQGAIEWASQHLRGTFSVIGPRPPLAFASGSLDVVYAVSVFTHLGEQDQDRWLGEIRRVLRPGGLFLATTHSPEISLACPGLVEADHTELRERGFLHVDRSPDFRERTTFHSAGYLEGRWSKELELVFHEPFGFLKFQDLSVWRRSND